MVQMFVQDLKKVYALERFCYKGCLRNSSGTKFFVRLRQVSALEDVHFREVPLYLGPGFFSISPLRKSGLDMQRTKNIVTFAILGSLVNIRR